MANHRDDERERLASALDGMVTPAAPRQEPKAEPEPPSHQDRPRVRPAAPVIRQDFGDTSASGAFDSESDRVNVPAPGPEVFLPRKSRSQRNARRRALESVGYRRTIVPIMLTLGVMLPTLCGLWYMLDEGSPFKKINSKLPPVLLGIGVLFLLCGILNVIQLKHLLSADDAQAAKRL